MPSIPLTIQFGSSGDYKLWAGDGWHHDPDDKQHTWADHVAKMRLMLEYTRDDVQLELDVIPVGARGVEQQLYVFINGAFVAFWTVSEASTKIARIEARFLEAGDCLFSFVTPNAIRPKEVGISQDERVIGLAFRSMSLTSAR